MKKWSKKTNIIGSLVALGSFPVIAAKCTEGNNGYVSKNDSPQVINPIKDGSQGQNDGDNTSNNDQPIRNSNKSDKAVKDSDSKKETDQSSTNNNSETPNNSSTLSASKTKPKESHEEATSRLTKELFNNTNQNHSDSANNSMLKPIDNGNTAPTNQNIKKKEMHNEAAIRLAKEYFDLLFDIQNYGDKLYKLSPMNKLYYIYKPFNKNSDIKSKLSTKELIHKLNSDLDSVFRLVSYLNNSEKEFFKKLGLDDEFDSDFAEFFYLLSSLISKNDDQSSKNRAEELFNKAKSKIDEAYNKEFKKK